MPVASNKESGNRRLPRFARLKPGHSHLDWIKLTTSNVDLRGVDSIRPYSLEEVSKHNKRSDCWMIINNRIYNVTPYLPFHPGGKGELMRAAGKDGTQLFMEYHSWVNPHSMLKACLVGFLS
ncbi:hypothetical protein BB560_007011 [Smittium megazygosporum]|uniref:Cytochrome b5 heme-binding domain-containing protein n=1 Tax=Smittium megazygosporum TaxID=133381 RepID=A0A2T9XZF5_9FUNG|nr:hypothetical protein BB560_007011 [Smittium megazygosporum]